MIGIARCFVVYTYCGVPEVREAAFEQTIASGHDYIFRNYSLASCSTSLFDSHLVWPEIVPISTS